MVKRENRLIVKGSPCDINYFDRNLLTIEQAREKGPKYCRNRNNCVEAQVPCVLRYGLEVAKYVTQGSTLQQEMNNFIKDAKYLNEEFWDTENGIEFLRINGKSRIIRAVERFARIILLEKENESVFPSCEKCNGIRLEKEVIDCIHDFPDNLQGSGKTKPRIEEYCPTCDQEPQGRIINAEENIEEDF